MTRAKSIVSSIRILCFLGLFVAARAQAPQLGITKPTSGSLVNSGQTISIILSADASVQNLWVITERALPEVQTTQTATEFHLTVPLTSGRECTASRLLVVPMELLFNQRL